jgi:hypothetical protein
MTLSPGAKRVASGPSASTVPAHSRPRMSLSPGGGG